MRGHEKALVLALLAIVMAPGVYAQEKYPAKVIRIVTAAPGSNHDWGARLVANELMPRIGQRVIVENRGSIATEYVAKEAPADGYTLLFYGSYPWLQPLLQKVNWDPLADLAPITIAINSPVLVVHPSLPVAALGPAMPHVRAAKVKALAVTTPRRSHLTPDLPTIAESLPG